jgi:hypothetical protein
LVEEIKFLKDVLHPLTFFLKYISSFSLNFVKAKFKDLDVVIDLLRDFSVIFLNILKYYIDCMKNSSPEFLLSENENIIDDLIYFFRKFFCSDKNINDNVKIIKNHIGLCIGYLLCIKNETDQKKIMNENIILVTFINKLIISEDVFLSNCAKSIWEKLKSGLSLLIEYFQNSSDISVCISVDIKLNLSFLENKLINTLLKEIIIKEENDDKSREDIINRNEEALSIFLFVCSVFGSYHTSDVYNCMLNGDFVNLLLEKYKIVNSNYTNKNFSLSKECLKLFSLILINYYSLICDFRKDYEISVFNSINSIIIYFTDDFFSLVFCDDFVPDVISFEAYCSQNIFEFFLFLFYFVFLVVILANQRLSVFVILARIHVASILICVKNVFVKEN